MVVARGQNDEWMQKGPPSATMLSAANIVIIDKRARTEKRTTSIIAVKVDSG